jgi:hypothetical protein
MNNISGFTLALIVQLAVIVCLFSSDAFGNVELIVNSSIHTRHLIKTKSKSRIKMSDVIIGMWSGNHISLEINENGAHIEYDCATGAIGKRIILDKKNAFDVLGTYAEEKGGPVRQNNQTNGFSVKYKGQVKGKKMNLTVRRADNNKIIGTFALFYGRESTLVKCR